MDGFNSPCLGELVQIAEVSLRHQALFHGRDFLHLGEHLLQQCFGLEMSAVCGCQYNMHMNMIYICVCACVSCKYLI